MLVIVLLGFSSGLPLALSGETLRVWMADRGVDLGTIGLLSLAGLPYTLKFIWAPVVDAWQVPWLSRTSRTAPRLAHRLAARAHGGDRLPRHARSRSTRRWMIGLGALIVAFASATQDIVVDAYRVQSLPVDEQAAGMAGYVAAYRIGMLASGAGVIGFSAWLETHGLSKEAVWPLAYAAAAVLVLVGLFAAIVAREPQSDARTRAARRAGSPLLRLLRDRQGRLRRFLVARRGARHPAVRRHVQAVRCAGRHHDGAVRPVARLHQGDVCGDRQRRRPCGAADRRLCRRRRRARAAARDARCGSAPSCRCSRTWPSSGSATRRRAPRR